MREQDVLTLSPSRRHGKHEPGADHPRLRCRRRALPSYASLSFNTRCADRDKSTEVIGTDEGDFWQAARAWIPELPARLADNEAPETVIVMDFIEFMFDHVGDCELGWHHE
ncbi:MAG: hypothetical protein ABR540_07770 [Acidimicrobiales bacterium]